jgi:aspartate carbamoyltransferase regulatory subunit
MQNTSTKHLSVSAIHSGTVVDHIPAGEALHIIKFLKLNQMSIMIGTYLNSKKLKQKDIIKIQNAFLSTEDLDVIAIFAPFATVNFIENFEIKEKKQVVFPEKISGILQCPNPACITQKEPVKTRFYLECFGKAVRLNCHFCEKTFNQYELKEFS